MIRGMALGSPPMNYSEALLKVRDRHRISRSGWNGTGLYVVYQKGYPDGIAINANTAESTGEPEGTVIAFLPYLMLKTATGAFVPWVASQTDQLAEDWTAEPVVSRETV